jgi:acetyl esterase/lipase
MKRISSYLPLINSAGVSIVCVVAAAVFISSTNLQAAPHVDSDGTVQVPAFALPGSSLLDEGTRAATNPPPSNSAKAPKTESVGSRFNHYVMPVDRAVMADARNREAEEFLKSPFHQLLVEHYPAVVTSQNIGGVDTEVFVPKDGVTPRNRNRVLIDLHGSDFRVGSRIVSHIESLPIAAIGRIKVISVDYRLAPEYSFPAASEDVAAVYRELLKTYRPQNIGIYGSSAGALLTAESIAWFQKEGLPLPGAIGMLCGAASFYQEGDSARLDAAISGIPSEPRAEHDYFKATDPMNPLAFPIYSSEVMAKFPPSLLVSATRDLALSSVVYTHSQLVKLGVEAELHVWEGLGHHFYGDPNLQQSLEVHNVVVSFFDRHLGE